MLNEGKAFKNLHELNHKQSTQVYVPIFTLLHSKSIEWYGFLAFS